MSDVEVIFEVRGHLGLIILNRPKALNALTADMCVAVYEQLMAWEADDTVRVVAVTGAGEKAFCAGGDVVKVVRSYADGGTDWQRFFYTEYRMNVAIDAFTKPYVALVDGITMGGGVGISIPGDYWVATEKTLFAMPETGLGLFPDVGGGWFLPRLPGASGMYLALTGARLKAADLYALGLASHVTGTDQVDGILSALEGAADRAAVEAILADAHTEPGEAPLAPYTALIDEHFDGHSVEDVMASLMADGSEWALKQHDILAVKSPTAMKISFEQLRRGEKMERFADNMAMEYRIVNRAVAGRDFPEGVRAILIDKDNQPAWSPETLDAVSDNDVAAYFEPLGEGEELLERIEGDKV